MSKAECETGQALNLLSNNDTYCQTPRYNFTDSCFVAVNAKVVKEHIIAGQIGVFRGHHHWFVMKCLLSEDVCVHLRTEPNKERARVVRVHSSGVSHLFQAILLTTNLGGEIIKRVEALTAAWNATDFVSRPLLDRYGG